MFIEGNRIYEVKWYKTKPCKLATDIVARHVAWFKPITYVGRSLHAIILPRTKTHIYRMMLFSLARY